MPRPCARECPIALKSPVRRENLSGIEPLGVLAGLVPAIPRRMRSIRPHAERMQETFEVGGFRTAWMPGTSPGTTRGDVCDLRFTTGLAEPDSRGLVPGIHAQKPSPTTSKVVCNGAACGRMLRAFALGWPGQARPRRRRVVHNLIASPILQPFVFPGQPCRLREGLIWTHVKRERARHALTPHQQPSRCHRRARRQDTPLRGRLRRS
jgi:hypothetical protein